MSFIYLDNSATTKPYPEVAEKMAGLLFDTFGNPSSSHQAGIMAAREMETARESVAALIGASPSEIIFTGSGTEADNLALFGAAAAKSRMGKHIISTEGEHPAVLKTLDRLKEMGFSTTLLPLSNSGFPNLKALDSALREDTVLISMMLVNNELGTVYPVKEARQLLNKKKSRALLHCDGVQALGKMPIRVKSLGVDLMSLSAHKIHGPKGCGALYVKSGVRILPHIFGGGQEGGLRSGTENTPGAAGFGVAARRIMERLDFSIAHVSLLRDLLLEELSNKVPQALFNSPKEGGVPHIVNISLPGFKSEVLLNYLDAKGICLSAASACASSRQMKGSVLTRAGFDAARVDSALRISFAEDNTTEDVVGLADALRNALKDLLPFSQQKPE